MILFETPNSSHHYNNNNSKNSCKNKTKTVTTRGRKTKTITTSGRKAKEENKFKRQQYSLKAELSKNGVEKKASRRVEKMTVNYRQKWRNPKKEGG